MLRSNLRYLGLGFLCSSLLLTGYQLVSDTEPVTDDATVESLKAEKEEYQAKYEETAAEYSALQEQQAATSERAAAEMTGPVSFTVEEGQPTAAVLEKLVEEGLIQNGQEAEKYLNDSGLLTQIRFGTYQLSRDMDLTEIFAILTGTE